MLYPVVPHIIAIIGVNMTIVLSESPASDSFSSICQLRSTFRAGQVFLHPALHFSVSRGRVAGIRNFRVKAGVQRASLRRQPAARRIGRAVMSETGTAYAGPNL